MVVNALQSAPLDVESSPDQDFSANGACSQWLDAQSAVMVRALARLVSHPSYFSSQAGEGELVAPFGQAIDACLDEALLLARELGLRTYKDPSGFYGHIELGSGAEVIGILCHLDVSKPEDESNWFSSPFSLELRNGLLYGCGTQQSKGPFIAALFALKALQDSAHPLRHTVRLIVGTDANQQWRCMERYLVHDSAPALSFSPTTRFPVVYAEKRLLQIVLHGPGSAELTLACGDVMERVPDRAGFGGNKQKLLQKKLDALGYPWLEEGRSTVVLGQTGSAERCDQEGINAIVRLCRGLQAVGYQHPALGFCSLVVGDDPHVRAMLGDVKDECSGKLTLNLAHLSIDEQESLIGLDLRIPVSVDFTAFQQTLRQALSRLGWRYELQRHVPPLFLSPASPVVTQLSHAYREMTGEDHGPVATGAVTYARALPNCIPFGSCLSDCPEVSHQANEHMALDNLLLASKIFACTLNRLQHIPLGISMGRQI
jgi:succinyl-diaminopimelate desuccinylase